MLRKMKLEKIAGIVALSYLVLIPAGAFYAWKKIQVIDRDVTEMWDKLGMPATQATPIFDLRNLFKGSSVR